MSTTGTTTSVPNTLHDFKRDTGIKPVYDTFDSAEVLEGKLMTSRSGYDVVVASNFSLPTLIKAGALRPSPRATVRAEEHRQRSAGKTGQQRPGQSVRRAVSVGHQRHRLQRRQS
jgi:hypothetical protein